MWSDFIHSSCWLSAILGWRSTSIIQPNQSRRLWRKKKKNNIDFHEQMFFRLVSFAWVGHGDNWSETVNWFDVKYQSKPTYKCSWCIKTSVDLRKFKRGKKSIVFLICSMNEKEKPRERERERRQMLIELTRWQNRNVGSGIFLMCFLSFSKENVWLVRSIDKKLLIAYVNLMHDEN